MTKSATITKSEWPVDAIDIISSGVSLIFILRVWDDKGEKYFLFLIMEEVGDKRLGPCDVFLRLKAIVSRKKSSAVISLHKNAHHAFYRKYNLEREWKYWLFIINYHYPKNFKDLSILIWKRK